MTEKLAEQIYFLRKQKNMTQEELAASLGVSGQAVSKWESAQCCPDIALIPKIADIFEVSIDELMGHKPTANDEDYFLGIRNKIQSLPKHEDRAFALRLARTLHATLFLKEGNGPRSWNTEDVIERASKGEWGYSCTYVPEMTACMWQGSLFFSDNENLGLQNPNVKNIVSTLKAFGDMKRMKIAVALYELTRRAESDHASADDVSAKCGISAEAITEIFEDELAPYIHEKCENGTIRYHFNGRCMHILPILSMFSV